MTDATLRSDDASAPPRLSFLAGVPPGEIGLFFASLVTLYFELLIIRYLSIEVRVFTNLKNLPLVASFFGIGLGMLLGSPSKRLRSVFPGAALLLFVLTRFASPLHISFGDLSWEYSLGSPGIGSRLVGLTRFLAVALGYSVLIIAFFSFLGAMVGQYLKRVQSLKGYGVNLAGGLAGMALFSLLAVLHLGPATWILLGFLLLIPLLGKDRLSNHAWYQWLADLSPDFLKQYPTAEPNRFLVPYYELPYQIVHHPKSVLILGAGTGNDVAGALRHGAERVDAVEIDPLILRIGQQYHPERPYDSSRVTPYVDDARAFLKKTKKKYDLIVFGLLDSTTLLSSFSSLRLDNYVYTVESFQDAKAVLADHGTLVLTFVTGRSFATDRLYATL